MPEVLTDESFIIMEAWGETNYGKSYLLLSFCEIMDVNSPKNTIIYLTNEANYNDALDEWKEYKPYIRTFFHRTLEEFESDLATIKNEYFKKVVNPKTHEERIVNSKVFAIIIDEGEKIYRNGYIPRVEKELNHKLQQKEYGIPRNLFTNQMEDIASLPCHFGIVSKVTEAWEPYYITSQSDPNKKYLQFRLKEYKKGGQTGVDALDEYRLPSAFRYVAGWRMHLVMLPIELDEINELGIKKVETKYFGILEKQKANREVQIIIEKPTIKKVRMRLIMERNKRWLQEKQAKLKKE